MVADGGAPVPGRVTIISPALDPGGTTVEVWVQAPNPKERLKAGIGAKVEIVAQTVPTALVVPQAAVMTSPSGNSSVIVVDAENKPHKKSVTLGIRDNSNVQITEGLETANASSPRVRSSLQSWKRTYWRRRRSKFSLRRKKKRTKSNRSES